MKKSIILGVVTYVATMILVSCGTARVNLPDGVKMETVAYKADGKDSLRMDIYTSTTDKLGSPQPVFIYSFGGGWTTGKRTDAKWLGRLAELGYVVVSIDYRLGMKGVREKVDSTSFGRLYSRAIDMGVEDLYDATAYIVNNASHWNVASDKIVIGGSSAGATNSVMAEYYRANGYDIARNHLPAGFRYAGVVAFAGGIWKTGIEEPEWLSCPCPFLICHGTADQLVSYNHWKLYTPPGFAAYGPGSYIATFARSGASYWFLSSEGSDHVVNGLLDVYPNEMFGTIAEMMERLFVNGEAMQTIEQDTKKRTLVDIFRRH
jgi:pimeloyl-ACP methyl ester carboxylesterase